MATAEKSWVGTKLEVQGGLVPAFLGTGPEL